MQLAKTATEPPSNNKRGLLRRTLDWDRAGRADVLLNIQAPCAESLLSDKTQSFFERVGKSRERGPRQQKGREIEEICKNL